MQQVFRIPQVGRRLHLIGADAPPVLAGIEVVPVEGEMRQVLSVLPSDAVLGVVRPSARDLLARALEGEAAPLDEWHADMSALLQLADHDPRVIPISGQALLVAPARVAADICARMVGAHAVATASDPSPVPLMAELVLQAYPAIRAVEARFAKAGVGVPPLVDPALLLDGACGILAGIRDLEQQALETRIELAEHDIASAAVLKLAQDQLIATRAAAAAAHADLRARLGDGPLPPLPGRDRDQIAAELASVLNSTSWRLTAPLRQLVDRLRRYRMKSEASM